MALPNFLFYYWTANVRALLDWIKNDTTLQIWVSMKEEYIQGTHIFAFARLPLSQPISSLTSNPLVIHSLTIWNQFRRHFFISPFSTTSATLGVHSIDHR